ncbi:MAG: GNAT family protein [Bryobacteraceae bacterium]
MFSHSLRPGVELRLVETRHAAAIWDRVERDRTHLREWLSWVDNSKSSADIEAWIDSQLKMYAGNDGFAAGIWVDGVFAGVVGTHPIHWPFRKVEIGYWLGAEFVGRGIITEAVRAIMIHAFRGWELNRVEIHCAVGNERSCSVARRLGFVEEGVQREAQLLNGRYVDIRVFAMLAKDWPAEARAD